MQDMKYLSEIDTDYSFEGNFLREFKYDVNKKKLDIKRLNNYNDDYLTLLDNSNTILAIYKKEKNNIYKAFKVF